MEKVWEELKKIDAQAEKIRSEAQNKAKEIISLSQKESEEFLVNSKIYSQQEAQQLYEETVEEANRRGDQQLETNRKATEHLSEQAQKRMEKASSTIVSALIGET
jgi:vacuolar-type H+-ATPase subunit H